MKAALGAWLSSYQNKLLQAADLHLSWGPAQETHSPVNSGPVFHPAFVAWHRLPVSLGSPCIGMPPMVSLCPGNSSVPHSSQHFPGLRRREESESHVPGKARPVTGISIRGRGE